LAMVSTVLTFKDVVVEDSASTRESFRYRNTDNW
jgi:hypothetical protein